MLIVAQCSAIPQQDKDLLSLENQLKEERARKLLLQQPPAPP